MDGWGREGMEVKSFRVKEFGRPICNKLGRELSQPALRWALTEDSDING